MINSRVYKIVSSDANRGNVAMIVWNTLEAPYVWDVEATEFEGAINLGNSQRSLLGIYFRDYVYTNKTTEADFFKEAEYLTVAKAPSMDKELGNRQIILNVANNKDFAEFSADFELEAPRKNYEEATWYTSDKNEVTAYVPEEVCADLEVLYGKEVTVIFGEDNVVVAIRVTNDSFIDNELVEKINVEDNKITVAGETYKYYPDNTNATEVYVNGVPFGTGEAQISKVITVIGGDPTSTRSLTKALKANVILDNKEKVERLDFTISGEYYIDGDEIATTAGSTDDYSIAQYVVENIKSKGDVVALGATTIYNYQDLIDDENEPKVIRGAKEIALAEIAEGDVLTVVYTGEVAANNIRTIYVSSEKATGEADTKTNLAIAVNGTKYLANNAAKMTATGKLKEAKTTVDYNELKKIDGEEVELYLNILGEYVALVADSSAADGLFGVVSTVSAIFEDEDSDFEEYRSIRIMLPDGEKATRYKLVYDESTDKTKGANEYTLATANNLDDKLITFKADADNRIMIEDVTVATTDTEGYVDGVEGKVVSIATDATVNYDKKRISKGDKEYGFTGAKFLNYASDEDEVEVLAKGWKSLIAKSDDGKAIGTKFDNVLVVADENDDVLLVFSELTSTKFVSSDDIFAIVTDIDHKDSGKETVTVKTVNGEEETYEAGTKNLLTDKNIHVADFVMFTVKDGKIDVIEKLFDVIAMNDLSDTTKINGALAYECDGTYTCSEGACTTESHKGRTEKTAEVVCACESKTATVTPTGYKCPEENCTVTSDAEGKCTDPAHSTVDLVAVYANCENNTHKEYVAATYSCEQTENPETDCTTSTHVGYRCTNPEAVRVNTTATLSGSAVTAIVSAIVTDDTTKENLAFDYNDKREDRLYYTDEVTTGTNKVASAYINNDNLVIIDLSNMEEDCEGIEFVESLAEIDGETVIAITINDDTDEDDVGAEILVVIK